MRSTAQQITLSQEQQALFREIEQTRHHLFITGKAGTGKSLLLQHVRAHSKKRLAVTAPTGIAALNVSGQTIHSLFRLPLGLIQPESLSPNTRIAPLLRSLDLLIIDEVSMVRADLMDAIDRRLRQARSSSLPFGGIQVVMYGDPFQLPPVVDDEELHAYFAQTYGGPYFFQAHVWQKTSFATHELTYIFRQKETTFIDLLNAVREGTVTPAQLDQLNARCQEDIPNAGAITLAATNALVSEINAARLAELPGKMYEYQATITGTLERSSFPTEEILQLKKGAQVILLRNDKEKRWVNGTLGIIHALSAKEIKVMINGSVYSVPRETWEKIRYTYNRDKGLIEEEVVSSFTQFPLRLAWAVTIHKSQGQTYTSVVVDLTHDTFAPGQLYVALSRCTTLSRLFLTTPLKQKHVLVSPDISSFMSSAIPPHA